MKLATESLDEKEVWVKPMEFSLSKGLMGFPDELEFELLINAEELPFMWIRSKRNRELGFVVIEPAQFLSDYQIEVADDDAAALGIETDSDALILNIITLPADGDIERSTANLVAPIILNRETMRGKQVIVSNHIKFSTKHPLLSDTENNG